MSELYESQMSLLRQKDARKCEMIEEFIRSELNLDEVQLMGVIACILCVAGFLEIKKVDNHFWIGPSQQS